MPVIPSIELVSYVGWIIFAIISVYITLQALFRIRNKISWGVARYMGIPMTIFAWMKFIYVLVLFQVAYGFVSFILDWPIWMIWIDISLFLVVLMLSLGLYLKLRHREKFKPNLFVALFLVPLGIPGIPRQQN